MSLFGKKHVRGHSVCDRILHKPYNADIQLPPLFLPGPRGYEPEEIRAWARRAIELDRQSNDTMLAHEWIRPALGLPEDAPYRFDFYAQEIQKLTAKTSAAQVSQEGPKANEIWFVRFPGQRGTGELRAIFVRAVRKSLVLIVPEEMASRIKGTWYPISDLQWVDRK